VWRFVRGRHRRVNGHVGMDSHRSRPTPGGRQRLRIDPCGDTAFWPRPPLSTWRTSRRSPYRCSSLPAGPTSSSRPRPGPTRPRSSPAAAASPRRRSPTPRSRRHAGDGTRRVRPGGRRLLHRNVTRHWMRLIHNGFGLRDCSVAECESCAADRCVPDPLVFVVLSGAPAAHRSAPARERCHRACGWSHCSTAPAGRTRRRPSPSAVRSGSLGPDR